MNVVHLQMKIKTDLWRKTLFNRRLDQKVLLGYIKLKRTWEKVESMPRMLWSRIVLISSMGGSLVAFSYNYNQSTCQLATQQTFMQFARIEYKHRRWELIHDAKVPDELWSAGRLHQYHHSSRSKVKQDNKRS